MTSPGHGVVGDDWTERLSRAVAPIHRRVEGHALMRQLLAKTVSPERYRAYLTALLPLYRQLEAELPSAAHAACGLFCDVALGRSASIVADLAALAPHCADTPVSRAQHAAVSSKLADLGLSRTQPLPLAAMAYVRYGGDLAGGQALGRHFARWLPLTDPPGGAFYAFDLPGGEATGQRLIGLRSQLLACLDSAAKRDAFIAAAIDAFAWHEGLFDAVLIGTTDSMDIGKKTPNKVLA